MGTSELKLNLHKLIDGISDTSVLQSIYTLLTKSTDADWYDELSDEAKASIKKGVKQADEGRLTTHKMARKRIDNFFQKNG